MSEGFDPNQRPQERPRTDYEGQRLFTKDMEEVVFGPDVELVTRDPIVDAKGLQWTPILVTSGGQNPETYYCARATAAVRKDMLRRPVQTDLVFEVHETGGLPSQKETHGLRVNPKGISSGKEYIAVFKGASSQPGETLRVLPNAGETPNLFKVVNPEADFKKIGGEREQIVYTNQNLQ